MHFRHTLVEACAYAQSGSIDAARRRRWDQPLGRPLGSSRSTAETVNPSVTQRLPVTKQLVCYPHKQQLHNCPSTPNSAPTIRPVFPPGQRYVVCGLPLSLAGPHVLLALFLRAHSCLSCPCVVAARRSCRASLGCAVHLRRSRRSCACNVSAWPMWGRRKCSPAVASVLARPCLMHAMLALVARKSRV